METFRRRPNIALGAVRYFEEAIIRTPITPSRMPGLPTRFLRSIERAGEFPSLPAGKGRRGKTVELDPALRGPKCAGGDRAQDYAWQDAEQVPPRHRAEPNNAWHTCNSAPQSSLNERFDEGLGESAARWPGSPSLQSTSSPLLIS